MPHAWEPHACLPRPLPQLCLPPPPKCKYGSGAPVRLHRTLINWLIQPSFPGPPPAPGAKRAHSYELPHLGGRAQRSLQAGALPICIAPQVIVGCGGIGPARRLRLLRVDAGCTNPPGPWAARSTCWQGLGGRDRPRRRGYRPSCRSAGGAAATCFGASRAPSRLGSGDRDC